MPILNNTDVGNQQVNSDVVQRPSITTNAPSSLQSGSIEQGPSFSDTLGAAFRQNNVLGSYLTKETGSEADMLTGIDGDSIASDIYGPESLAVSQPADPNFDPFADIDGYDPSLFVKANNQDEVDAIKRQVDKELRDKEILEKSGTLANLTANIAAGLVDPTMLLPFASVSKGAGILKNFAKAGLSTAASVAAQEGALQSMQQTRTAEESIENVAAAALIGGALGPLVAQLTPAKKQALTAVTKQYLNGASESTIGAAQVIKGEGSELAKAMGLDAVAGRLPLVRTATLKSQKANAFFESLLENPLARVKNAAGRASDFAVETEAKLAEGDKAFISKSIKDAYAEYAKGLPRDKRLGLGEFKSEIYRAMYRGDASDLPQAQKLAQSFRTEIIDKWREQLVKSKLLDETQLSKTDKSYVPRAYNINKILFDPEGFKRSLVAGFSDSLQRQAERLPELQKLADAGDLVAKEEIGKISARMNAEQAEISQAAQDVVNNITGLSPESRSFIPKSGLPKSTKSRMDVATDFLEDYVNTDVEEVLHKYVSEASGSTSVANRYGDLTASVQRKEISEEYDVLIKKAFDSGQNNYAAKLQKEKGLALSDMDYYLKAISGAPANISNHDTAVRVGRAIRQINSMRMLGNVVLSSLVEPIRTTVANGVLNTLTNLPDMFKSMKAVWKNAPAKDLEKIAIGLDGFLNSRVAELQMLDNTYGRGNILERGLSNAQKFFFQKVGLNFWTDWDKHFSSTLFSKKAMELGEKLSKGANVSQKDLTEYASMGLSSDDLVKAFGEYSGKGDLSDYSLFLNTDSWDDKDLAKRFLGAVKKSSDSYIVSRKAGSVPQILSDNEPGKIFAQFMGYSFSATTDVLYKSAQKIAAGDARGVAMLSMMTLAGVGQYMIKEIMAGREIPDDPKELLYAGFDQGGAFGLAPNIIGKMDSATGNAISDVLGLRNVKYRQQDIGSVLAGPTGDFVSRTGKIGSDVIRGQVSDKTLNNFRRLIPFQNWFIVRNIFDKIEESVADTAGLEKKQKKDYNK